MVPVDIRRGSTEGLIVTCNASTPSSRGTYSSRFLSLYLHHYLFKLNEVLKGLLVSSDNRTLTQVQPIVETCHGRRVTTGDLQITYVLKTVKDHSGAQELDFGPTGVKDGSSETLICSI